MKKLSAALCSSIILCACINKPAALGPGATGSLDMAARYDASPPAVPEIADSLTTLFRDPQLNAYIKSALANNPDLRASAARLEEAGFNTRKTQAGLSPELYASAAGGATR